MRRTLGVFLVLFAMTGLAVGASAQQQDPTRLPGRQASEFSLEQNFPNPVTVDTRIPFTLGESLFAEGRSVVVTVRVYNILLQPVSAATSLRHPSGDGVSVMQLEYAQPGRHEVHWNGRDQNGQRVAPGVYWVQLTVNGASLQRRISVAR